jgi:hypothetical protein
VHWNELRSWRSGLENLKPEGYRLPYHVDGVQVRLA